MRLVSSLLFVGTLALAPAALAAFPDHAMRIVVPAPPGNGMDVVARILATGMAQSWGQPVVVENRAGGGGTVGMVAGKEALADGHTMVMGSSGSLTVTPYLGNKLPYEPGDFLLVNSVYVVPLMIAANGQTPYQSLNDIVRAAKQQPGVLTFAYGGPTQQLVGELFKLRTGTNIPGILYKGSAPAATDMLGGHVPLQVDTVAFLLPHLKAGKARAIAVTTASRVSYLAQTPTVAELGFPGFEGVGWAGIVVPKGTPPPVVQKIGDEVRRQLLDPKITQLLTEQGFIPDSRNAAEWKKVVDTDAAKWSGVINQAGIKAE